VVEPPPFENYEKNEANDGYDCHPGWDQIIPVFPHPGNSRLDTLSKIQPTLGLHELIAGDGRKPGPKNQDRRIKKKGY
jgi:hypothetical protein